MNNYRQRLTSILSRLSNKKPKIVFISKNIPTSGDKKDIGKVHPELRKLILGVNADLGFTLPRNGDLTPWEKSDILFIRQEDKFTTYAVTRIAKKSPNTVFVLLGESVSQYVHLIPEQNEVLLYPSPLAKDNLFNESYVFSSLTYLLNLSPDVWRLR